jgi:hypothetical protein
VYNTKVSKAAMLDAMVVSLMSTLMLTHLSAGLMWSAMDWIKKNGGLDTEESYQYEGVDDTCRFKNATIGVRVSGVKMLPTKNEDLAAWIVDNGPAAVAVNAE